MKMLRTAFAGMLLLSSVLVHAQSADEIVNKHIAAIGGKDVIAAIKTQIVESEMVVGETAATTKMYVIVGKGLRAETNVNGNDIVECITKDAGWMINPFTGSTDAQAMPQDRVKASQGWVDVGGRLYNYKEKGSTVTLEGNESVEGVNAIKLKVKDNLGRETTYYLDPATYYIVKLETTVPSNGQDLPVSTIFSNYKKTDSGLVMAFSSVRTAGPNEIINKVTKVEFNKEIDAKILDMPK